jgi:stage III sporulation protein AE
LKLLILAFTAYLSLTGVIRGSADSAAVKAAKLAISSAVPVVGSMIADASETLLVSAGLLRSGIGVFGLLGVLAISIGPFLETGISYLMLKLTAAAASVTGEKRLSGLISAMAGAMGLITAVTGVCTLLIMIGCVCFMKEAM